MATSSVFRLIANDGKADRMIMATELLNQRIKDIMCMRANQGFADPTPTLVDIERTHILFVNAHFKPFAAHGFEYFKQRPQSGGVVWGQSVQFSIPQYGDFFSDMAVHVVLAQTSATAGTVPATFPERPGLVEVATTATSQISETVGFPNATTYTRFTQEYVNSNGTVVATGSAASNFVRYCEYPGERLFSTVRFDVNSNPLDEYYPEAMVFRRKFEILPHKLTGWKRIVGQEVPIEGVTDPLTIAGTSYWPGIPAVAPSADVGQSTAINGLTTASGNSVPQAPANQALNSRKVVQILNGPQTPKAVQPSLEMFIPLDFWFNKDVRLAVPSVSIPFGQRFITIYVEEQNKILFTAPGNLFLRLTVEQISAAAVANATPVGVTSYNKWQTLTPVLATGSNIDSTQQIRTFDLYINNIFMNPEIHDIYIKRIGFTLIRTHLRQVNQLVLQGNETQLQNLKWPIEYMYVAFRPTFNVSNNNPNQYRDWHRFGAITDQVVYESAKSDARVNNDAAAAWSWAPTAVVPASSSQIQTDRVVYPEQVDVVDALGLTAHGIKLFELNTPLFYNAYQSYTFGGSNQNTPEDKGCYLFTFCFYPGTYNPSGHFNVSRAREFYINVASTYINSVNTTEQIILVRAINFLLISDGSAVLRYST